MTPVERLQAAIDKLETLKAESTPGPWSVNVHHNSMHSAEFRTRPPWNGFMLVAAHGNDTDPDLIVTLHRTIDAQVDVLRMAQAALGSGPLVPGTLNGMANVALALADAILGVDS